MNGSVDQRGSVAVIATGFLVTALIMGALVIDLGYLFVTRNQLQNIADSAALAAGRALGAIYRGGLVDGTNHLMKPLAMHAGTNGTGYALTAQDQATIQNAATEAANEHFAGGKQITDITLAIGRWDHNTQEFTEGLDFSPSSVAPNPLPLANAVQVTVQRAPGQNGPVTAFFAGIIGISTLNVSSTARAALLPLSFTPSNQPPPPIVLSPPGDYAVSNPPGDPNIPSGNLDLPLAVSANWAQNACGLVNPATRPHPLLLTQARGADLAALNINPPWPPPPPPGTAWDPDPADPAQGGTIGNSCVVIHTFREDLDVGTPGTISPYTPIVPINWGDTVIRLRNGNFQIPPPPVLKPVLKVDDKLLLGPSSADNNAADPVGITETAGKNSFLRNSGTQGPGYFSSRVTTGEGAASHGLNFNRWSTIVPVYQGDCSPQTGPVTIVGFTAVTLDISRSWISIESLCPTVGTGRSVVPNGNVGQNFGTLASIPVLVCNEDDPMKCPQPTTQ